MTLRSVLKWLAADSGMAIVSGVVALLAAFLLTRVVGEQNRSGGERDRLAAILAEAQIADLKRQFAELRKTVIQTGQTQPPNNPTPDLQRIDEQLKEITAKLTSLESAIESSPEKALSIPMLRKDIDDSQKHSAAEFSSVRNEIAHTYDLLKWFLGLIATMAITMLVTHLRRPKSRDTDAGYG